MPAQEPDSAPGRLPILTEAALLLTYLNLGLFFVWQANVTTGFTPDLLASVTVFLIGNALVGQMLKRFPAHGYAVGRGVTFIVGAGFSVL